MPHRVPHIEVIDTGAVYGNENQALNIEWIGIKCHHFEIKAMGQATSASIMRDPHCNNVSYSSESLELIHLDVITTLRSFFLEVTL